MVITSISLTENYPINIENRYDLLFVSGQYYVIKSLNLQPVTSKQKNGFDMQYMCVADVMLCASSLIHCEEYAHMGFNNWVTVWQT